MTKPRNPHSLFGGIMEVGDIASNAVTTVKIVDSTVALSDAEAALKSGSVNIALSLEAAAELGTFKIYFPMKVTIDKIRTVVTKVVGGTSAATVTCGNISGASPGGVVTIAASAAIGEEDSATPTGNNVVAKDGYYYLTTYKAGNYAGMIETTLEYSITA